MSDGHPMRSSAPDTGSTPGPAELRSLMLRGHFKPGATRPPPSSRGVGLLPPRGGRNPIPATRGELDPDAPPTWTPVGRQDSVAETHAPGLHVRADRRVRPGQLHQIAGVEPPRALREPRDGKRTGQRPDPKLDDSGHAGVSLTRPPQLPRQAEEPP